MSIPIFQLRKGMTFTPKMEIRPLKVRQWTYASECGEVGGGLMPGFKLSVEEISTSPTGPFWVRLRMSAIDPPQFLKVSGEEFALNFRPTAQ